MSQQSSSHSFALLPRWYRYLDGLREFLTMCHPEFWENRTGTETLQDVATRIEQDIAWLYEGVLTGLYECVPYRDPIRYADTMLGLWYYRQKFDLSDSGVVTDPQTFIEICELSLDAETDPSSWTPYTRAIVKAIQSASVLGEFDNAKMFASSGSNVLRHRAEGVLTRHGARFEAYDAQLECMQFLADNVCCPDEQWAPLANFVFSQASRSLLDRLPSPVRDRIRVIDPSRRNSRLLLDEPVVIGRSAFREHSTNLGPRDN